MQNQTEESRLVPTAALEKGPPQISCGFSTVFNSHKSAIAAIREIKETAFDMTKLSIVGKDYHVEQNAIGFYKSGSRIKYWGKLGALWGGIFGMLSGPALFLLPGVGPLFVAGQLMSVLADVIEGAVIVGGAGILGAALFNLGISNGAALEFESAIRAGKYVMLVHGTQDDLKRAREIANNTGGTHIFDFDSKELPISKVTKFLF